ncbi:hypothetical protein [Photorhabdus heterorhabditis]|nr:hypothetical protein [Photorhabdus heterorhabditis]
MITKNFHLNAQANTYAAIYHDVTTRNGGAHGVDLKKLFGTENLQGKK